MRVLQIAMLLLMVTGNAHAVADTLATNVKRAQLFVDELVPHLKRMVDKKIEKTRASEWLQEVREIQARLMNFAAEVAGQAE